jgi:DNA-binding MarR family transcriptional regulator
MNGQETDLDDAHILAMAEELRLLISRLKRRLREQTSLGDLTPSQVSVFLRLESEGPATVTRLAKAEGVRPQSMGATVTALEAMGLVSGAPDPEDGRQTILSLTPSCRARVAAGRAARQDWLFRAMKARLAPDELRKLAAATGLLKRLAEP